MTLPFVPLLAFLKCVAPIGGNPATAIRSSWHGTIGRRDFSCNVCMLIVETAAPRASLFGRCRIPDFRRRRRLGIGAIGPYEGDGDVIPTAEGEICPRGARVWFRPQKPQPCIPSDPSTCTPLPPTPLPKRCCRLLVDEFSVPFDADAPPSHFKGTFVCPNESGDFEIIRDE